MARSLKQNRCIYQIKFSIKAELWKMIHIVRTFHSCSFTILPSVNQKEESIQKLKSKRNREEKRGKELIFVHDVKAQLKRKCQQTIKPYPSYSQIRTTTKINENYL